MDPLSHGLTGALCARTASGPASRGWTAAVGALAGMAPDLDGFIRSESDPLVYLQYHRHFTHALAFVPVGSLACAALLWLALRRKLSFWRVWLFAFLGMLPHGLLDAFTSYGTSLWWPFSEERVSWSWVSVVDPLYTLPLAGFLVAALWRRKGTRTPAFLGLAWAAGYLALGGFQLHRAEEALRELARERGSEPVRLEAKPAVFVNFLFRGIYEAGGRYSVDAVRVGWFSRPIVYEGGSVAVPEEAELFAGLEPGDAAYRSIERFRFFCQGLVYQVDGDPDRLGDLRYSMLPNSLEPLWLIEVGRDRPDAPGVYVVRRDIDQEKRERFWRMLLGRQD